MSIKGGRADSIAAAAVEQPARPVVEDDLRPFLRNVLAGVQVLDDEDRDAVRKFIRKTHGAVDESTRFDVGPD